MESKIRTDLFSVKVRGEGFEGWCHERIFRTMSEARQYRRDRQPLPGYALETKIVHPTQWVVDAFSVDNTIS